jgi:hypothetical protein
MGVVREKSKLRMATFAPVPSCGQQDRRNGHAVRHLVNNNCEKYDRTQLRQNQTRAESNSVQKTVKGDAEESRDPHLMDITVALLAGMDEDKPFHGQY